MKRDSIDFYYWSLFSGVMLLNVPLDLFSTYLVLSRPYGFEVNPIFRWILSQGVLSIVFIHKIIGIFCTIIFYYAVSHFAEDGRSIIIESWLSLLLIFGLLVVTNNMLQFFFGTGLL